MENGAFTVEKADFTLEKNMVEASPRRRYLYYTQCFRFFAREVMVGYNPQLNGDLFSNS